MRWSKLQVIVPTVFLLGALNLLCPALQKQTPNSAASPSPSTSPDLTTAPKSAQPEPFVMIDASHGGEDKGVVFTTRIAEKDVTLALARLLRKELQDRGIAARLLREGDSNLTLQHRAEISNQQRPALYVALHAGEPGSGVRVYSPLLPTRQPTAGDFIAWDDAQAASLERSISVARTVTQELKHKDVKARNLQAFLRPLNNILAPAIGIEIAVERNNVRSLDNLKTQSSIASALASAIAQSRSHWGGHK